jgi:hypothetical protein
MTRRHHAKGRAGNYDTAPLFQEHAPDGTRSRTNRETNRHFAATLLECIRRDATDADDRQRHRDDAQRCQEGEQKPLHRQVYVQGVSVRWRVRCTRVAYWLAPRDWELPWPSSP